MAFVAAVCPQCSGALQVPDDRDVVKCMYCGVDIVVRQAIQVVSGNAANLLELAQSAAEASNNAEAYGYFTKVLEIEPRNSEAWFGKGTAAGWQSTLADFRFSEMIVAFENAMKFAPEESKEALSLRCALSANAVATACYSLARKHMQQFVALDNTWAEYLPRCKQIISLMQTAQSFAPTNQSIIENIIFVCKDNIEGVEFKDPYNNNVSKAWHLSASYESEIRAILNEYANKLKVLNPEYVAPNPVAKKPTECFVVTAALGNDLHPSVVLLRDFRDRDLVRWAFGRWAVSCYARVGPPFANAIRDSDVLRSLARSFVVWPAVTVVRGILVVRNRLSNVD